LIFDLATNKTLNANGAFEIVQHHYTPGHELFVERFRAEVTRNKLTLLGLADVRRNFLLCRYHTLDEFRRDLMTVYKIIILTHTRSSLLHKSAVRAQKAVESFFGRRGSLDYSLNDENNSTKVVQSLQSLDNEQGRARGTIASQVRGIQLKAMAETALTDEDWALFSPEGPSSTWLTIARNRLRAQLHPFMMPEECAVATKWLPEVNRGIADACARALSEPGAVVISRGVRRSRSRISAGTSSSGAQRIHPESPAAVSTRRHMEQTTDPPLRRECFLQIALRSMTPLQMKHIASLVAEDEHAGAVIDPNASASSRSAVEFQRLSRSTMWKVHKYMISYFPRGYPETDPVADTIAHQQQEPHPSSATQQTLSHRPAAAQHLLDDSSTTDDSDNTDSDSE
jgi:hypothetical protein